jgi:hypothetical protein
VRDSSPISHPRTLLIAHRDYSLFVTGYAARCTARVTAPAPRRAADDRVRLAGHVVRRAPVAVTVLRQLEVPALTMQPHREQPDAGQVSSQRCRSFSSGARGGSWRKPSAARRVARRRGATGHSCGIGASIRSSRRWESSRRLDNAGHAGRRQSSVEQCERSGASPAGRFLRGGPGGAGEKRSAAGRACYGR